AGRVPDGVGALARLGAPVGGRDRAAHDLAVERRVGGAVPERDDVAWPGAVAGRVARLRRRRSRRSTERIRSPAAPPVRLRSANTTDVRPAAFTEPTEFRDGCTPHPQG